MRVTDLITTPHVWHHFSETCIQSCMSLSVWSCYCQPHTVRGHRGPQEIRNSPQIDLSTSQITMSVSVQTQVIADPRKQGPHLQQFFQFGLADVSSIHAQIVERRLGNKELTSNCSSNLVLPMSASYKHRSL